MDKESETESESELTMKRNYSEALDNPSEFMTADWERFYATSEKSRFICLKGTSKVNVLKQIQEFSELNGKGEIEYSYGIYEENNWTYVKIPNNHDAYSFHNLTYWFLGTSVSDPLHSDESVGIFVSSEQSYVIYNDYDLRNKYQVLDVLFLASNKGIRELVSIPFDVVVTDEENWVPSYTEILKDFNLSETKIMNKDYEEFTFLYPE